MNDSRGVKVKEGWGGEAQSLTAFSDNLLIQAQISSQLIDFVRALRRRGGFAW